jgi:predicted nucleotidyltransferase
MPSARRLAMDMAVRYMPGMTFSSRTRAELLDLLCAHEAELRARGVEAMTLFGSVARDDATDASDVDLAMRVGAGFSSGGFDHFGQLEALRERLRDLLGCEVDLVEEPAARPRLRDVIAREGVRAF